MILTSLNIILLVTILILLHVTRNTCEEKNVDECEDESENLALPGVTPDGKGEDGQRIKFGETVRLTKLGPIIINTVCSCFVLFWGCVLIHVVGWNNASHF
jgi:hypothetical protein